MAITLTKVMQWQDTKAAHVIFSVAVSGNYPTGGEDIVAWQSPGNIPPIFAQVYGDTGGYTVGLIAAFAQHNPALTSTKLKAYSAANTEVAAAAYPAGFPATLYIYAIFEKKF